MSLEVLPTPIDVIDVPDCVSASSLGYWKGCLLKLIAGSMHDGSRLPSSPEAAAGTLVHRALERLGQGSTETPDEAFDAEYDVLQEELRADPRRCHFSDLRAVLGSSRWNRLRARVATSDGGSIEPAWASLVAGGSADVTLHDVVGVERKLESRRLRIRGRADEIRRTGTNSFEVRDYKTGGVVDAEGIVRESIALQLQAYGLMLLDMIPTAQVRLVVDDGSERDVAFDAAHRSAAEAHVESITSRLPIGSVTAVDVATPGPGCWQCSIRHVCTAYLALAPVWWSSYPDDHSIPLDVWGTVTEIRDGSRRDILLEDDAGRRTLVRGVSDRHSIDSDAGSIGRRLWFFGLESRGPRRGFDGRRYQPRAFHELPRDGLERRAWMLQVFGNGEEVCGVR